MSIITSICQPKWSSFRQLLRGSNKNRILQGVQEHEHINILQRQSSWPLNEKGNPEWQINFRMSVAFHQDQGETALPLARLPTNLHYLEEGHVQGKKSNLPPADQKV